MNGRIAFDSFRNGNFEVFAMAVLRPADPAVHHGGSGTMLGALVDGTPQVLIPRGLPERARDRPATIRMDLHMLLLFRAARERTQAEFRELLERNGFDLRRVVMTASPAGLGIIEAAPLARP